MDLNFSCLHHFHIYRKSMESNENIFKQASTISSLIEDFWMWTLHSTKWFSFNISIALNQCVNWIFILFFFVYKSNQVLNLIDFIFYLHINICCMYFIFSNTDNLIHSDTARKTMFECENTNKNLCLLLSNVYILSYEIVRS